MFSQIKLYLILALVVSIAGIIGYQQYVIYDNETTIQSLNVSVGNLARTNQAALMKLESNAKTVQEHNLAREQFQTKIKTLETELSSKTQIIDFYKGRQDVVFKRPGLVELKEQKALDDFLRKSE